MFMGTFYPTMDTKGRISFPAKLREDLGDRFYVCKGLDGCLFVYPEEEWSRLKEKISALPMKQGRSLQRYFYSGAVEIEPDKQGRFVIPPVLREHADLSKDVIVIGAANRAEIWDARRWSDSEEELTNELILETMDEIGF